MLCCRTSGVLLDLPLQDERHLARHLKVESESESDSVVSDSLQPHGPQGIDLVDRVHEELWTEFRDIVQEAVIKTIPKKKKHKRPKWLFEEALQIGMKIREVKGKGDKERYTHLNAKFQRIARRDKKDSFSDQCKDRGKQ